MAILFLLKEKKKMDVQSTFRYMLSEPSYRWLLAALKGLRNGAVYGVRIRLPHALVMTFLFGKGK